MRRLSLLSVFAVFAFGCEKNRVDPVVEPPEVSETASAPPEEAVAREVAVPCKITLTYDEFNEEEESPEAMWTRKQAPVMAIASDYEERFFEAYNDGDVAAPPATPRDLARKQAADADPRIDYTYNDEGMPIEAVVDPTAQSTNYTYTYEYNCDPAEVPPSTWPKQL